MIEVSKEAKQAADDFWGYERPRPSLLKDLLNKCFDYHCPNCGEPFKAQIETVMPFGMRHDPFLEQRIQRAIDEAIKRDRLESRERW